MADLDDFFDEGDDLEEEPGIVQRILCSLRPAAPERSAPKGNTPRSLARDVRRQVLREATGQSQPEPDEWRDALKDGRRTRADALLRSKAPTHNSGSGFGAAHPNREVL